MKFTYDEMSRLRDYRKRGATMAQMCTLMGGHVRDEVVEALDALVRYPNTREAMDCVNRVLDMQGRCIPLINGWEAWEVERPPLARLA